MPVTRRQFLGSSAAAVLVAGTMSKGTVLGANDRVRIGVAGLNSRGGDHLRGFSNTEGSEVVAICDVDSRVLEGRAKWLEDNTGKRPKTFVDIRDMIADPEIDAVSYATPNHWHALGSVWACQAGKHVFVEKPVSHNYNEGVALIEAANAANVVVQHGTQSRSDHKWIRAMERIHSGVIGEVYMARALCYKNRDSIGFKPDEAPPEWLDWTLWQGPAPEQPFNGNYVHYNWHWFWAYGNGDIGNQGVHQMDIAAWGMNKGLPNKVFSMGGRYAYEDQGETPNTQVATLKYPDGTMTVFEVRGRATNAEGDQKVGNLFYGSGGYAVGTTLYDTEGKEIPDEAVEAKPEWGTGDHYRNFITAIRNRDVNHVHGNALQGHTGCAHIHLSNIAYRVKASLDFDPASQRFLGNDEANTLLTRVYREGFEVPQPV
ncbi:MAG: Gfo/Idh/MocA family protein [Candidatus Hydrogenedentales bacterium]|jgi:predicted dehydrogenase